MTAPVSFDQLAPHYEWLERVSFGPLLQSCRVAMLPHVRSRRNVLIVGDGDGRFLAALLDAMPDATVDTLDISPSMIELARKRIAGIPRAMERVRFRVADIRTDPVPGTGYDLIVTNFLLDCFGPADLNVIINKLSDSTAPDGRWIVGDFEVPMGPVKAFLGRIALAGMYGFFRLTTRIPAHSLADPAPFLSARGWEPVTCVPRLSGFLVSRLWARPAAT